MTKEVKGKALFDIYKEDFNYCEKIIKKHSKTFYAAFSTLPKEAAMSVYAVYAFCRKADDVVDEEANEEGLLQLEKELQEFENGNEPDHPVWRALRVVFSSYQMDIKPFYDMILGQKKDLKFTQPESQEELLDYSYYVASSVGLMLLPILTDQPDKVKEEAIALGKAMQITNILRDIGEDLDNGRVYLPLERMEAFGYSYDMLKEKNINEAFIALWESEAEDAEVFYQQALGMVDLLNEEAKKPLLLSLFLYREILSAVRLNDYDCFTKRAVVSKIKKIKIIKDVNKRLD